MISMKDKDSAFLQGHNPISGIQFNIVVILYNRVL